MQSLTKRALRVFAVLEDFQNGSEDILQGLLPFFEPDLAEQNGQLFAPSEFAKIINSRYHWNLTSDVIEELIPRFVERSWLEENGRTRQIISYRVILENQVQKQSSQHESNLLEKLQAVAKGFKDFITDISPLTKYDHSVDELADILVEWIVSVDAFSEDILQEEAISVANTGSTLSMSVEIPDVSNLSSEDKYICARYVKHLFETESPYTKFLCELSSVGLLTEVVQDFIKPTSDIENIDLIIYLDAPVAMELLGVSGADAAENIRNLVDMAKKIGVTFRIFEQTKEEIKTALSALLKRNSSDRTGPTATALRKKETTEAFVSSLSRDPTFALDEYDVTTINRTLDQFPSQHKYFTNDQYLNLISKINWHLEISPREHDASLVCQISRMRQGFSSNDLFKSKHVILTKNAPYSAVARKFSIENQLFGRNSTSPVLHQRQLATMLWLRAGSLDGVSEIPKRHLLSACEKVLELKKSVIDNLKAIKKALNPEVAKQLDLLMSEERSVQLLQDKTLGVSSVITIENTQELIDGMKSSLIADEALEIQKEYEEKDKKRAQKLKKARSDKRDAISKLTVADDELAMRQQEDLIAIQSLIDAVNSKISRDKICLLYTSPSPRD